MEGTYHIILHNTVSVTQYIAYKLGTLTFNIPPYPNSQVNNLYYIQWCLLWNRICYCNLQAILKNSTRGWCKMGHTQSTVHGLNFDKNWIKSMEENALTVIYCNMSSWGWNDPLTRVALPLLRRFWYEEEFERVAELRAVCIGCLDRWWFGLLEDFVKGARF